MQNNEIALRYLIDHDKKTRYSEGHFLGVGIALGMIIFSGAGVALAVSTGNLGLLGIGPAIGLAIGLAIGKSMEDDYRKKGMIRPLTKKEKEGRKKAKLAGVIALVIGVLVFLVLLFAQ
ncbi:hypothetical protein GF342_05440 [Candidatus Woesearchaeota archaeon]|nr:hypothetical protein [Candidatus Woesearchaeota archaeon]